MGKNQAYKAMQRSRLGSSSAAPDEVEDGMVDSSFHSPEWHAARLASLKTSHTVTWEEYKKKQKEEELRKGELEADKDRMMIEYRAQLDAERAHKLAHGRNHSSIKFSRKKSNKLDKKDRDSRKHSSKRLKHSRRSSDSSSSSKTSSADDDDDDDDDERKATRSKSRLNRRKKEKKHSSRSKQLSKGDEDAHGPLPLSRFFGNLKD